MRCGPARLPSASIPRRELHVGILRRFKAIASGRSLRTASRSKARRTPLTSSTSNMLLSSRLSALSLPLRRHVAGGCCTYSIRRGGCTRSGRCGPVDPRACLDCGAPSGETALDGRAIPATVLVFEFLVLTACRPGEVRYPTRYRVEMRSNQLAVSSKSPATSAVTARRP